MSSMNILTPDEITFGDSHNIDSHVHWNRARAGSDIDKKLVDVDGIIISVGLEYIKIITEYGPVRMSWHVTGSANGILSNIYNFIGVGVPVTVCANRDLKNAYSWCGTSMKLDVCDKENKHFFSYDTRLYTGFDDNKHRFAEWTQWCGNSSQEIGKFIGKGGWKLRELLEDNNLDNTHFKFYDECDGEKTLYVFTMNIYKEKVVKLISEHLIVNSL